MGGYCIHKRNREALNGQEVIDIDISTSNEPECETAKFYQPRLHMLFLFCGMHWKP